MKLSELQDKYIVLVDKSAQDELLLNVRELFADSFKVRIIGADEKLGIIRAVNEGCIKKIGKFEYIDYGLQKIALNIAILAKMTDLELDESDGGNKGRVVNYDIARRIGVFDYLWDMYKTEMEEIEDFLSLENRTVLERNSIAGITEKKRISREIKEEEK